MMWRTLGAVGELRDNSLIVNEVRFWKNELPAINDWFGRSAVGTPTS